MICPEKRANFLNAAATAVGKGASKAIPVIGAGFSVYDLGKDLAKGDLVGAGLDTLSGGLNLTTGFLGMPAVMGIDMYNSYRRANRDRDIEEKEKARQYQQAAEEAELFNKQAESNFSRDVSDPRAGISSDLYRAISPILGKGESSNLTPEELAKEQALQEQVRKGLVGLEYLTGIKQNTGNTYYDEHPVGAVATDLLGNAGLIGAGTAAGGSAANLLNQYRNFKMTRPAQDARTGNYGIDPAHPRNLLNPKDGPTRADISRIFGDFETDPLTRLQLIDELNSSSGTPTDFVKEFQEATQKGEDPSKLFQKATKSPGAIALEDYANFHESAQRAKAKGGFKKYFGEDLHISPEAGTSSEGLINKFTRENLAPAHMQGLVDMAEAQGLTSTNPNYHPEILKRIGEEYSPGAGARAFASTGLNSLENKALQSSGLKKLFRRVKLPLATGAAIAAGGAGLHHLVKALQNQAYSKPKLDEWKKTLLQSRGDFDRAAMYGEPAAEDYQSNTEDIQPQPQNSPEEDYSEAARLNTEPGKEQQALQEKRLPTPNTDEVDWSAALNSMR